MIVFQHANVIEGVSSKPLRDVSVMIANGKIAGRKNLEKIPAGAEVIDLTGNGFCPDTSTSHVHFNFEAAQRALRFGVTTARTMAGGQFIDVEIRARIQKGRTDLPEVLAAGPRYARCVHALPGFAMSLPELADMKSPYSGTENVRRLVRAFASRGVDHIKVLASERAGTPDTDPRNEPSPTRNSRPSLTRLEKPG